MNSYWIIWRDHDAYKYTCTCFLLSSADWLAMSVHRLSIIGAVSAAGIVLAVLWMSATTHTYARLHLFIMIPALLLMFVPPLPLSNFPDPAMKNFPYIISILLLTFAFAFSAPWEYVLCSTGVLRFNEAAMFGTLAYIPYEEIFWWVDHSLLAAFWVMSIMPCKPVPKSGNPHILFRVIGVLFSLGVMYYGYYLYDRNGPTFYMSVHLMFAFPVIAIQFLFCGHLLREYPREWILGILVPSLLTILTDRYALHMGIWEVDPVLSTGIDVYGFKLEHVLAYSLTTALAVQTVIPNLRSMQLYKARRYTSRSVGETVIRLYTLG